VFLPTALSSKMIVYIQEFDKYDEKGRLLCRNFNCTNYPILPYKKYCSKGCNKDFRRWYYHNFFWERVRSDVFKRDKYTCQLCKRQFLYSYRKKFVRASNLECDHIIPRSMYQQLGYKYDTLEQKVRVTLELFHNHSNLRTVCTNCHKKLTSMYLSNKFKKEGERIILKHKSMHND
jgi:5-methylcytosine-specific restriction endonuclease McrA